MRIKVVKVRINPIATATRDEPHYVCTNCGHIDRKEAEAYAEQWRQQGYQVIIKHGFLHTRVIVKERDGTIKRIEPWDKGKYPSKPIYREVAIHPSRNQCPKCGSYFTKPAGYGDRLECQKCGKVFR
jgi:ribosomal protein S27AE